MPDLTIDLRVETSCRNGVSLARRLRSSAVVDRMGRVYTSCPAIQDATVSAERTESP